VDHRDAVVQVGAKAPRADLAGQVAAGRRDDARFEPQRTAAPHPLETALLQDAEQASLLGPLQLPDLVEEERPAGGALQPSRPSTRGPGEGTPLVAEELALEQARRERRAVDVDDRPRPRRVAMQQARTQALADTGLPGDQHRGVERRQA
jgi:hypothetical protein